MYDSMLNLVSVKFPHEQKYTITRMFQHKKLDYNRYQIIFQKNNTVYYDLSYKVFEFSVSHINLHSSVESTLQSFACSGGPNALITRGTTASRAMWTCDSSKGWSRVSSLPCHFQISKACSKKNQKLEDVFMYCNGK